MPEKESIGDDKDLQSSKKTELEPYIFLAKSSGIFLLVDDETTNTLLSTLSRRLTNDID